MVPNSPTFANKIARIDTEINAFESLVAAVGKNAMRVEKLADFAYQLSPKQGAPKLPSGKTAGLTLMGLTHGNEVGGVVVLNELLRGILGGVITCPIPLNLILGNPWAARKDVRFVDRDLNRSFLLNNTETAEAKRADVLEQVLAKTAYLVDFHQTREISENPFFIFPHTKAGFAFAQAIAPQIPVVTHWGKPFSEDGRCSDEFVNSQGGVGITIEVGQNGYAPFSIGAGVWVAQQAIRVVHGYLNHAQPLHDQQVTPQVYTWLEILRYGDGDISLVPGWRNFSRVDAGQKIGEDNGRTITAPAEAWLLFPQYPKAGDKKRPAELVRLMRRISVDELPK